MHFHVITLFPEPVRAYIESSILGRAIKDSKLKVSFYNPRDFTADKWKRVDKRPYGGGPGMVLEAPAILKAVEKAVGKKKAKIIFFTPSGKLFTNARARTIARGYKDVVLICGHYEGIDARVRKILKAESLSIGDYTLTGGEVPAMAVIDAVSRQIPGILGNFGSLEEERVAGRDVYTRPRSFKFKGKVHKVPSVLLSGNHAKIEKWKLAKNALRQSVSPDFAQRRSLGKNGR